jgi:putative hydrolase of the HAD superfamily
MNGSNVSSTRAILFDLDETLTDRPSSIAKMCHLFLKRFSNRLTDLNLHDLYRRVIDADRGGYRPKEEFFAELYYVLPWDEKPSVVQIAEFWQAEFPRCTVERYQATQTLRLLREQGFLLGLVTNGRTAMQNAKIDSLTLREYFQTIIISETVGVKKPDPRIFTHALNSLKIAPIETVFVGDHPLNDIVAAQAIGMKAVWLRGSHEWPLDIPQPQFYIDTLMGVLALLE